MGQVSNSIVPVSESRSVSLIWDEGRAMVCDRPLGIEFLPDKSENLRIIGDSVKDSVVQWRI